MGACKIDRLGSNEGGNAHEPDAEITGDLTASLRAERDGTVKKIHAAAGATLAVVESPAFLARFDSAVDRRALGA